MSTITTSDGTRDLLQGPGQGAEIVHPGGTHARGDTSRDQVNADLLAFCKA